MTIKCVVACRAADGTPTFYPCQVDCSKEQYDNGDHYDAAAGSAEEAGYELSSPFYSVIVYDEYDYAPNGFFELFDWAKAPIAHL